MGSARSEILHWIQQGRVPAQQVPQALHVTGITPSANDWRRFFSQLSLWLGAVFCAAAVIFFFAYNWQAMGRYAKFGLVELLIVLTLGAGARLGLEKPVGKAALLLTSLLTGALLALAGQTYQTGADNYELFAAWAIAILPWVLIGRLSALWLLWLGLLNLTVIFYFQAFGGGIFDRILDSDKLSWLLLALNTAALIAWEAAAQRLRLQGRWPQRILACTSGAVITQLTAWSLLDGFEPWPAAPVYALWLAAGYAYYRHLRPDLFVLSGGALSAIVVITALLIRSTLIYYFSIEAFFFIGLVIISLSTISVSWLKNLARKVDA